MNVSITSSKAFISRLLTNWPNSNQSVIECNDLSGFYFYPTECYGISVENWLYWVNYPTVTPHNSIFNSFRTHRMVWLSEAKKMKLLNGWLWQHKKKGLNGLYGFDSPFLGRSSARISQMYEVQIIEIRLFGNTDLHEVIESLKLGIPELFREHNR